MRKNEDRAEEKKCRVAEIANGSKKIILKWKVQHKRHWRHWRIPSSPIVEAKHYENTQWTHRVDKNQGKKIASIKSLLEKWLWWESSMNLRRIWGTLADPVVANSGSKTLRKYTVDSLSRQKTWNKFKHHQKQYSCSKNSRNNRRIWGTLADPVVANSGKKACGFLM